MPAYLKQSRGSAGSPRVELALGFTLVELVVVLLLVGVLSAISLPRLIDRGTLSAPVVADQVAQALRYARDHAVASGCPVQATVASTQVSLRRPDALAATCAANFNETVTSGDGSGPYVLTLGDGHTITDPGTLVFQPDGSLSGLDYTTTVATDFTVTVHAATGYVQEN